ncbi:MAG: DUF1513 domain-containing protein [Hyphomicrobiaceae bacterium]
MTAIDRRTALAWFMAAPAAAWFAGHEAAAAGGADRIATNETGLDEILFVAARKAPSLGYSASIFRRDGTDVASVPLPGRGHDAAWCKATRTCVIFARRPGTFAVAISPDHNHRPVTFASPAGRHFYGHGVFSTDGRLLYATENDYEAATGCLGIYDATDRFRRIGEFPSHGTGPHDIALIEGGRTLVVANGGIETHPDIGGGREKLNLPTMEPSLAYIDSVTGDLIESHRLPADLSRLSLRHLAIGAGARTVIGSQFEGAPEAEVPLVTIHRRGRSLVRVDLGESLARRFRGYVSSVAVDTSGDIAAVTSARGGVVAFIDVSTGRLLGHRTLADVSGVAPLPLRVEGRAGAGLGRPRGGFLLTSGHGIIAEAAASDTDDHTTATPWHWDNHAEALG